MNLDEKYIYQSCLHPVKIRVVNPCTHIEEEREVPCGKCLHCRMTRVSEWTTRMVCESLMYAHVYFITLTYDSDIIKDRPDVLADTHACVHSFNQFHRPQLAPLTLCKRHTQLFWKRLRKNTGKKFSYYLCGEYGHKFGRPHYHAIVWSDVEITRDEFLNAWQLCSVSGFDYDDLKVPHFDQYGKPRDPIACYSYVTKYLFKDFKFTDLPTYKLHKKLYDDMYTAAMSNYDNINGKFYYNKIENYVQSLETIQNDYSFANLYAKNYDSFTTCSRKCAIGSRYLQEHIQKYSKGDLRIFGIHGQNLIFPSYYTRKVKEYLCPYKPISQETGKPVSPSSTYSLLSYVSRAQDTLFDLFESVAFYSVLGEDDTRVVHTRERLEDRYFNRYDFYDCMNKCYFMYMRDDCCGAHGYVLLKYNRHIRRYDLCDFVKVQDILPYLLGHYQSLYDTFIKPFEDFRQLREKEKADYIYKVYGTVERFEAEKERIYSIVMRNRDIRQAQYKLKHQIF